ncbi:MAG: hypothetical protein ACFFE8_08230 [Candidatus Heimdallarchaeota archaeon]
MKKIGDLAKGAVKGTAKEALRTTLNVAVKEVIDETGVKDIARQQVLEAGKKILGDKNIPNQQKIQKEILKTLIKKELGL